MRTDFNYKSNFVTRVRSSDTPCFAMVNGGYVLVIAIDADMDGLLENVKHFHKDSIFGVSLPFVSAAKLPSAFRQAKLALDSGSTAPGAVSKCADYAYQHLLYTLSRSDEFADDMLHPALGILSRYDEEHKTELFNTLYVFLACERNVNETAKRLFLHRNSMLYRIQRIESIVNVDLTDEQTRTYIMMSYHLADLHIRRTKNELLNE